MDAGSLYSVATETVLQVFQPRLDVVTTVNFFSCQILRASRGHRCVGTVQRQITGFCTDLFLQIVYVAGRRRGSNDYVSEDFVVKPEF